MITGEYCIVGTGEMDDGSRFPESRTLYPELWIVPVAHTLLVSLTITNDTEFYSNTVCSPMARLTASNSVCAWDGLMR